ncbi:Uma2 family endonuclease [Micromonospora sp. NPDC049559]|uniref:Uma2 family endonuclease n=1 Tax=Micromonospora sp. NPDC049559 TaxID=3155923 RepID=UPI0034281AC4
MTSAVFGHGGPWTEEEYLALGETPERVELLDGGLLLSAAGSLRHQAVLGRISEILATVAHGADPHVLTAVNVRLRPGRIVIPDLVITGQVDLDELVVDAAAVRLVCEITSPGDAAADKVLKMHYYATAHIPWYLLVEQETGTLHLYRLRDGHYAEESVAKPGETLHLTEPVEATLRPEALLP